MSDGEDRQVGQAGQVGRQVGHRVVVQVELLQQETPGQARREVCEAILGKVKSLKTGLESLQGVGQAVDAVAGEREEVEIREVEEAGGQVHHLVGDQDDGGSDGSDDDCR